MIGALPLVAFIHPIRINKPVIKRGGRGSCKTPVYSIRINRVCVAVRLGLGL